MVGMCCAVRSSSCICYPHFWVQEIQLSLSRNAFNLRIVAAKAVHLSKEHFHGILPFLILLGCFPLVSIDHTSFQICCRSSPRSHSPIFWSEVGIAFLCPTHIISVTISTAVVTLLGPCEPCLLVYQLQITQVCACIGPMSLQPTSIAYEGCSSLSCSSCLPTLRALHCSPL